MEHLLEAVDVDNEIYAPSYNSQKNIFIKVMQNLKTVLEALAQNDETISGDIIYDGDIMKWRKLINSCYLRVLMGFAKRPISHVQQ